MGTIRLPRAFVLLSVISLSGCQSSAMHDASAQSDSDKALSAPYDQRTPDGDRLDGPISYGHWPYNIARGGA